MDPSAPERSGPPSSDAVSRPLAEPPAIEPIDRTLRSAADLGQLERMLLALAVHPEGPGFDRVQILLWDARAERLCAWRTARNAHPGMPAALAVERARTSAAGVRETSARDRSAGHGIAPASLDAPARSAWERLAPVVGPGAGASTPWRPGVQVGAVPLRRNGGAYALLLGEWDIECPIASRQETLDAWSTRAADALEALDHAERSRMLSQQSAALGQMAHASVSPGNLAEVLHLLASLAAHATGARGSAVWLAVDTPPGGEGGERAPRLEVTFGPAARRERLGRALQPLAAAAMAELKPRNIERTTGEMLLSPDAAAALSACAVVPLVSYGKARGVIAVYDRVRVHPAESSAFTPAQLEFLVALTDMAALAVDHAARLHDLRQAEQRGREQAARMRTLERLATLGEAAAKTSHEARNPLASIRGFARRAAQGLAEDDPRHEYLEIVLRETERIERLLSEELDPTAAEPPMLALGSLNELAQEALQRAGETLVRRRVRLLKKLSPELPALVLDRERIRHVLGRILGGALDAVAIGGRVRIETRRAAQHVVVEVAHDGARTPGESLEQLFVPFGTGRSGGPALGLAVAQRIVQEHGGEIRVRAEGEWSTVIAFTLPIPSNQDRRRPGPDRRHERAERRKRFPAS